MLFRFKQEALIPRKAVRGLSIQICSKLCLLGGGQMAEAILNAITTKGVQEMKNVNVYDISKVIRYVLFSEILSMKYPMYISY